MSSFYSTNKYNITNPVEEMSIGRQASQQDTGFYCKIPQGSEHEITVMAVLDGHGAKNGALYSSNVRDALRLVIESDGFGILVDQQPASAASNLSDAGEQAAFATLNQYLPNGAVERGVNGLIHCNQPHCDLLGGTTATIVCISTSGKITTFQLGDSDAFLVSPTTCTKLTSHDHSATSDTAWERIQSLDPKIRASLLWDNYGGRFPGNSRGHAVFPKDQQFGCYYVKNVSLEGAAFMKAPPSAPVNAVLAMTSSFGDHGFVGRGLSSRMDYTIHQAPAESVVVVASDGIWDVFDTRNEADCKISSQSIEMPGESGSLETFDVSVRKAKRSGDARAMSTRLFTMATQRSAILGCGGDNIWMYSVKCCSDLQEISTIQDYTPRLE